MLELRPSCEHCAVPLPPEATQARICSYECTFCAPCVETLLQNVCPNCGGGFFPRPIRPRTAWKDDNFLGTNPASTKVKHKAVNPATQQALIARIGTLPPEQR